MEIWYIWKYCDVGFNCNKCINGWIILKGKINSENIDNGEMEINCSF